jgi:16S rRNA (guanine527-N7)-methyltransferase
MRRSKVMTSAIIWLGNRKPSVAKSLRATVGGRAHLTVPDTPIKEHATMINPDRVSALLTPFGIELTASQVDQVTTYLDLLMRWNRRINLTSIRDVDECITRHFGESLLLLRWLTLEGRHLDIGSGAGFPGLALKIAFPLLAVTLLEPVGKRRAFLKEVVRTCEMKSVDVRPERLEEFVKVGAVTSFDSASSRAVGGLRTLISGAVALLKVGGKLCLWLTREKSDDVFSVSKALVWDTALQIPGSRQRLIHEGTRVSQTAEQSR